jgi:hypothetical protein
MRAMEATHLPKADTVRLVASAKADSKTGKVTLLSLRQQSLTRRCQANTIERRAFNDQPTLSNRPIHCSLSRSFVDLQTAGHLMQHDWLQGPAIDGGPRDLRDNSAGKNFIILHARPTPRWAQAFPRSILPGSPELSRLLAPK